MALALVLLVGATTVAAFGLHAVLHDSCRTEQRQLTAQIREQAGPGLAGLALRKTVHRSCEPNIDPDEHYVGIRYDFPRGLHCADVAQTLREAGWKDYRGGQSSMRSPNGRFEFTCGMYVPTGHPRALLYTFDHVPSA